MFRKGTEVLIRHRCCQNRNQKEHNNDTLAQMKRQLINSNHDFPQSKRKRATGRKRGLPPSISSGAPRKKWNGGSAPPRFHRRLFIDRRLETKPVHQHGPSHRVDSTPGPRHRYHTRLLAR